MNVHPGDPNAADATSKDPQDAWAYRIAVGSVGAAIVVFLIGAAVIAAVGKTVPSQYWTSGSALSGALLGILAPSPTSKAKTDKEGFGAVAIDGAKKLGKDIWENRSVVILLVIFGLALWRDLESHSTEWQALAAAAGGALIGMLAPSPGKKQT